MSRRTSPESNEGTAVAGKGEGGASERLRVLLVDDHAPTRAEMFSMIAAQSCLQIAGQAGSGEEAIRKAKQLRPDVVIMDILLPDITGVEATTTILRDLPETRIVALSNHCGRSWVQAFLGAGGMGFVRKDYAFEELIPAIQTISRGESFLGSRVNE